MNTLLQDIRRRESLRGAFLEEINSNNCRIDKCILQREIIAVDFELEYLYNCLNEIKDREDTKCRSQ